jgi:ribonuclease HI
VTRDVDQETAEPLQALELRLLQPEVRADVGAVAELLADDFCEIGSSGALYDKADVLAALTAEAGVHYELREFQARRLSDELIRVHYISVRTRATDATPAQRAFRTSIWRRSVSSWQLVFHQGTPIASA